MKKLSLIALLVVLCSCGVSTPYDTFKEDNKDAITFSVSTSAFLAHMFIDEDDVHEIKSVVHGVKRYKVLVADDKAELLEAKFKELAKSGAYEKLFYLNEQGNNVTLYMYKKKDKIREILLKVKEGNDFVLVSVRGNLKIKDVNVFLDELAMN